MIVKKIKDGDENTRRRLTRLVSTYSVIGVAVLGITAILAPALSKDIKSEDVKFVFTALLPLLGTWMGTVLAFYYSKENFEAANKSVQYLIKKANGSQRLKEIMAAEAWMPLDFFSYLKPSKPINQINIAELLAFFDEKKVTRVPILDETNCLKHVIHKSTLESFIAHELMSTLKTNQSIDLNQITLEDLKQRHGSKIQRILLNGFAFIKEDESLLGAKKKMRDAHLQDVFATKDGKAHNPVLGWITNRIIMEKTNI